VNPPVDVGARSMTQDQFAPIRSQVYAALPATVQALAVAWTYPYLVDYNSVTNVFAVGFKKVGGISGVPATCGNGATNPMYDQKTTLPYTDKKVRPTMMLAANNVAEAKAMIDRGVAADGTKLNATGYVMKTSDNIRNVRARNYPSSKLGYKISLYVNVKKLNQDEISGTTDSLFYFGGTAGFSQLGTNNFPKGAMGDSLTSYGGVLGDGYGQTDVLQFLKYGLTGSYGTAVEPCAIVAKFSDPQKMIKWYTSGDTLIEAYWKSVKMPFEGVFVGEPLCNPWYRPAKRGPTTMEATLADPSMYDGLPSDESDPDENIAQEFPIAPLTPGTVYMGDGGPITDFDSTLPIVTPDSIDGSADSQVSSASRLSPWF